MGGKISKRKHERSGNERVYSNKRKRDYKTFLLHAVYTYVSGRSPTETWISSSEDAADQEVLESLLFAKSRREIADMREIIVQQYHIVGNSSGVRSLTKRGNKYHFSDDCNDERAKNNYLRRRLENL
jgi:hypothetical protein